MRVPKNLDLTEYCYNKIIPEQEVYIYSVLNIYVRLRNVNLKNCILYIIKVLATAQMIKGLSTTEMKPTGAFLMV